MFLNKLKKTRYPIEVKREKKKYRNEPFSFPFRRTKKIKRRVRGLNILSFFTLSVQCSTPGFPVHHQLPELAQTHVHRVGDAVQPSHPLLFPVVCIISQSLSRAGLGFCTSNRYHLNFFYTLSHGSLNCIPKFTFK